MSADRFYPYRVAAEQMLLDLSLPEGPDLRRTGDGSIVVYEEEPDVLKLNASVLIADSVFDWVLAPSERANPPVDVRLVCSSRESRRRSSISMPGDGIHEGELTLERQDWRGIVEIRAVLVRTDTASKPSSGFAADRGASLAWSSSRRVLFDEPPQPPGDQLEVKWENFAESTNPARKRNAASIFALDTSGEQPVVFLNLGVHRAVDVLGSAGTHGRKARIRDATNYMIVHQVWTSLVGISLAKMAAIKNSGESVSSDDLLGEVGDWEARTLRDWSRHLYPDLDHEDALETLIKAADNPVETQEIMSFLPSAIQQRFRTFRGFEGLVREGDTL